MADEQLALGLRRRHRRRAPLMDTSLRAASKAAPFCVALRERIYAAIETAHGDVRRGLIASELAEYLCEPVLDVRRRLSELHRHEQRVRDSGMRRDNSQGNPEAVWVPA